jgi:hypothetical protein
MSGVEGVIASAVGRQLIRTLGKFAAGEITLQWKYREDVLDMEEKMRGAEAVLLDADEKLRRGGEGGRVFQLWLTKFKRVAYDAEDVLDEWEAKELINKNQSKVYIRILNLLYLRRLPLDCFIHHHHIFSVLLNSTFSYFKYCIIIYSYLFSSHL